MEKLGQLSVSQKDSPEMQVSAAEFILEGLHAHKRIGRSEERVFTAGEKQPEPVREKVVSSRTSRPYRQRGSLTEAVELSAAQLSEPI